MSTLQNSSPDRSRFYQVYALSLVGVAGLLGALHTVQFAVRLNDYGGIELAWRLVLLSALRSIAPAANGTALLLALLLWSQLRAPAALKLQLPRQLKRGLLLSLLGYPAATLLVVAVGSLIAASFFAVPLDVLPRALRVVRLSDVGIGYLSALVDALVISLVAWRGLPALHAGKLSLPAKLAVALPVLFVIRSVVGLALPGGPAN